MTKPKLTPLAQSLPAAVPFVGPEAQERQLGQRFSARLGANENGFGPSPRAVEAMQKAAAEVWMYGDPESYDLKHALAAHHGIPPDSIMIGEGIDGLLGLLVRLYVAEGTPVVTSAGAYPTFNYHVAGFGGMLHKVAYKDDCEDPCALITKARETGAKLIYLANPDNPMGTWHSANQISKMINELPPGCLLILDEAYIELADPGVAPPIELDQPNVIRMRTFSKGYGMAGARIGYAISHPEVISGFNKVRNHFGLSRISQIGALAALEDADWLIETQDKVRRARWQIEDIAQQNGLTPLPSATNFIAVDCGSDGVFARAVLNGLIARGVFVRMPFVAPQDRCIRISCGPDAELRSLAKALPLALEDARKI